MAAVVTFVVAAVLAPAVVVAGGAMTAAVSAASTGWTAVSMVSAAAAIALASPEPSVYTETMPEYGSGVPAEQQEDPPMFAVWEVDSSGSPGDNPGEENWFRNGGIIHLHYQDEAVAERVLCVQWLGGTRPVSLEFGQSGQSALLHTALLFKDFATREKIFDPNTNSSLSPVPDRFYLSISKKEVRGTSDYTPVFTFVSFNPESDNMVALVNGEEGLTTRLEDSSHTPTEEKKYKNIFKVHICTDEIYCPGKE